jgi:hypothetical protein
MKKLEYRTDRFPAQAAETVFIERIQIDLIQLY